jgi:hypothetical protein
MQFMPRSLLKVGCLAMLPAISGLCSTLARAQAVNDQLYMRVAELVDGNCREMLYCLANLAGS